MLRPRRLRATCCAPARPPGRRRPSRPPRRAGPRRRRRLSEAAPARRPRRARCAAWSGSIARVEAGIAAVEAALADPAVSPTASVAARGEEHRALQEELAWLMREWERAAEAAAG